MMAMMIEKGRKDPKLISSSMVHEQRSFYHALWPDSSLNTVFHDYNCWTEDANRINSIGREQNDQDDAVVPILWSNPSAFVDFRVDYYFWPFFSLDCNCQHRCGTSFDFTEYKSNRMFLFPKLVIFHLYQNSLPLFLSDSIKRCHTSQKLFGWLLPVVEDDRNRCWQLIMKPAVFQVILEMVMGGGGEEEENCLGKSSRWWGEEKVQ